LCCLAPHAADALTLALEQTFGKLLGRALVRSMKRLSAARASSAGAVAAAVAPAARARTAKAAPANASSSSGPPLAPSVAHADGLRRCWGTEFTDAGQREYHDGTWGRALAGPSAGRLLYKQLVLQTFQAGLSWAIVLKKEPGFAARFAGYDYARVAAWTDADVAAAVADAGVIRNEKKIRAAVTNARIAAALDARGAPGGFVGFCWAAAGRLPAAERLLQHGSRSGSWMRGDARTDYATADGVHPTAGVMRVAAELKRAGFAFLGPAATLSWLQATGFVNHHKPDCAAFAGCEAAFAAGAAAHAAGAAGGAGVGAAGGGGAVAARVPAAAARKRAAPEGAAAGEGGAAGARAATAATAAAAAAPAKRARRA